ncbi:MAG: hypothetical protein PHJ00_07535 [Candidatus Omnitrophica bacterium]|nr:hypothetical protein [Candidatus Omnitrophota bacterium]
MKKFIFVWLAMLLAGFYVFSQVGCGRAQGTANSPAKSGKTTFLLMVAEQNIESPQKAWWMSDVNLSTVESALARKLLESGYEILEPSVISGQVKADRAFERADLQDTDTVKLGKNLNADYVVLGKAVASAGGNVPQSSMRSCFANVTAKVIRVSDGKVIAYLDAAGSTIHTDVITGGREALANAGQDLAGKVISAMAQEGSK